MCRNRIHLRNRLDSKQRTDGKHIDKLIAKPHFRAKTIYTKNLAAIQMSASNTSKLE